MRHVAFPLTSPEAMMTGAPVATDEAGKPFFLNHVQNPGTFQRGKEGFERVVVEIRSDGFQLFRATPES